MRKLLVVLTAIGALAVASPAAAATATVSITKLGFVPGAVSISTGDTVTWTNNDTVNRQVVSTQGGFSSPVLKPGESYSRTFANAGRFTVEDPLVRPRDRMTVTVTAPAGTIAIDARPRLVVYGAATTVSGSLSTKQAGEKVQLFAQACGASFTKVADTTTGTDGAFSFTTKPLRHTAYRVHWKNVTSATVTVRVRPRLRLGRLAARKFNVTLTAAQSFAGKSVLFQRWNAVTRRWVNVRSVVLNLRDDAVEPTVVSGRVFRAKVAARRRVRVLLPQAQAGTCYAASASNVIFS